MHKVSLSWNYNDLESLPGLAHKIINMGKSYKEKQWGLGMEIKGLKQVANAQCSALLYP